MQRTRVVLIAAVFLSSAPLALAQSWTELAADQAGPTFGEDADAAYDGADRAIITFGGKNTANQVGDETWLFDLASRAWRRLDTPGALPPARKDSAVCYDPAKDRLLVFAGGGSRDVEPVEVFGDLWSLDIGAHTWTALPLRGDAPPPMRYARGCYDSGRHRFIVFRGDVWAMDLATDTWSFLAPSSGTRPPFTQQNAIDYDAAADRVIVHSEGAIYAFSLATNAWQNLAVGGPAPGAWLNQSGAYDPARRLFVVFGGENTSGAVNGETWAFDLASGRWTLLAPSPNIAPARYDERMIFNPLDGNTILFGGVRPDRTVVLADVWEIALPGAGGGGGTATPAVFVTAATDQTSYAMAASAAQVSATVRDESGAPIAGLRPTSFIVDVDGAAAAVTLTAASTPGVYRGSLSLATLTLGVHVADVTATDARAVVGKGAARFAIGEPLPPADPPPGGGSGGGGCGVAARPSAFGAFPLAALALALLGLRRRGSTRGKRMETQPPTGVSPASAGPPVVKRITPESST